MDNQLAHFQEGPNVEPHSELFLMRFPTRLHPIVHFGTVRDKYQLDPTILPVLFPAAFCYCSSRSQIAACPASFPDLDRELLATSLQVL
jgi:hypothetical protein